MKERMTDKERETLKALQAKEKRVQRAEAEFLAEADERKEELLKRWGIVPQKSTKHRVAEQAAPVEVDPVEADPSPAPIPKPKKFDPVPLNYDQL